MINVYHCTECGHEWESATYTFACPKCGADAEIMIELSPGFCHRMLDTLNDMEQAGEQTTAMRTKFRAFWPEDNLLFGDTDCTLSITDRRKEIEDMYGARGEKVRYLIEECVKTIAVDSKDNSYLSARLSPTGKIEIVDQANGKVIPWHRLNDDEQWALWFCFNDLIDEIDKVTQ